MAANSIIAQKATQMTLSTLRRTDPLIEEILFTASHVVVYKLDAAGAWQPVGIEGAMYIVRRNGASPHELVVLNRKNPENFVAEITPRLALDTSNPEFLFLRSPSKDVFGLWFHDQTQIAPSVAFIMKVQNPQPQAQQQQQQPQPVGVSPPQKQPAQKQQPMPPPQTPAGNPVKDKKQQQEKQGKRQSRDAPPSGSKQASRKQQQERHEAGATMSKEEFRLRLLHALGDDEVLEVLYRKFVQL